MTLDDLAPCFDNTIMAQAWLGCLRWALTGDDEGPRAIRAAFEEETGKRISLPRSVLERLMDQATGFDGGVEDYFTAFVPWFNANVWGDDVTTGAQTDQSTQKVREE